MLLRALLLSLLVLLMPGVASADVIVKFRPGETTAGRPIRGLARTAVVRGHSLAELRRDPRVEWATPNVVRVGASVPNDALYAQQWGLPAIGAPAAWDLTTGSPDVKVAVVDSGVNFGQPDLAGNLAGGWDFVQDDDDPSDTYGHGTRVAGIVAARGNNGLGVTGVAWRTTVIPVRVLDNKLRGTCAETAAGMAYAVRAGARIVNLSFGMDEPCQAEQDVIESAPDTLFVAAAMNRGRDVDAAPTYPCSLPSPNIVCVAATDAADQLASFSNYGARNVDLAAPGVNVLGPTLKWGPVETLFTDSFETPLAGRWVAGGTPNTWDRTPFMPIRTGGFSLSNARLGTYGNNTDNWVQVALDLRGLTDCGASVYVRRALGPADELIAEASRDGAEWSRRQDILTGTNTVFEQWIIDLSRLEGYAGGGLRFRLVTDGAGTAGGIALDDLKVFCVPPLTDYTGAADEFDRDEGTSVAAPHVSGVAALMLALEPGLSALELKRRLLASVDPLPSLAGKTVTGGRLNAARALAAAAAAPPASPDTGAVSKFIKAQVRAIAQMIAPVRPRAIARRGGLVRTPLAAPAAGRLTLTLLSGGRKIAAGSCTAARAGSCPVTARLNRRGRKLLRRARHPRVTFVLAFLPTSGPAVVHRAKARLGSPTPRHGGS
jgi:subtilisin family serine protease